MKRRTCIAAATCAALAGAIIASAVVIAAGRHADDAAVDEIDCAFGRIAQSLNSGGTDGGFMVELTEEFAYRDGIGLGGGTNEYVFRYFADENGPVIYMHNDDDRDVYVIDGMCYDVSRGISAIYPVEQMSSKDVYAGEYDYFLNDELPEPGSFSSLFGGRAQKSQRDGLTVYEVPVEGEAALALFGGKYDEDCTAALEDGGPLNLEITIDGDGRLADISCAFEYMRDPESLLSARGCSVKLSAKFTYGAGGETAPVVKKYFAVKDGEVQQSISRETEPLVAASEWKQTAQYDLFDETSRNVRVFEDEDLFAVYTRGELDIYRISALEKVCSMSYYSVISAVNCEQGRLSVSLSDQLCNYDLGGYAAPEAQTYIYSVDDFSLCQKVVGETERESVGEHYYPQYYPALGMLDQLFTKYGELDGYEVLFNTTDDECSIALYDGGNKEYVCVFPVQRYNGNPASFNDYGMSDTAFVKLPGGSTAFFIAGELIVVDTDALSAWQKLARSEQT